MRRLNRAPICAPCVWHHDELLDDAGMTLPLKPDPTRRLKQDPTDVFPR